MPLSLPQKTFLVELAGRGTIPEALESAGITSRTLRRWQEDGEFKDAYERIVEENLEVLKSSLGSGATEVADFLREELRSETTLSKTVSCPDCGNRVEVSFWIPNWNARHRAAEMLLKSTGVLKERRETEIKGQVKIIVLTAAEQQAFLALERGIVVPPHMLDRLHDLGLIEVIEGEVIRRLPAGKE